MSNVDLLPGGDLWSRLIVGCEVDPSLTFPSTLQSLSSIDMSLA
jgi:hypothetical protein